MPSLLDSLAMRPLVLDGGLGTLLERHGHDLSSALWSTQTLLDDPEAVRTAHGEYLAAGAEIVITGSYQVGYDELATRGIDAGAVDVLLATSVRLAREARDAAGGEAWVAASIGPFGAMRADGSEYTGEYGIGVAELRAWHRPRLHALAAAGPDLLAAETIPSLAEVEALAAELSGTGIPAWISVTPAFGRMRSGERLEEAFAVAAAVDEVIALGVNCCDPLEVSPAIAAARAVTDKPVVVYPNSGEQWDAKNRRWVGRPGVPDELVTSWLDAGARIVGGCCRIGPAEIARIAAVVSAR
ncbi:homocysteine S-methyltransferase [Pseudolysinimonas sp.]|uniref:homocysteine S-methyltransferase n=1 Tax=Pseudolysinimonas sp. TaxID=2680009 RepID=UPI00286BE79B|nr:homocysteine S-methyltransferase [Pseudolysinimonas sp.]